MLQDASHSNDALRARALKLEEMVKLLIATAPRELPVPAAPPPMAEESSFSLTKTRQAIEEAVKEAAQLPADERRRKLKALRLKWHPDKHDVLKEVAEEVTKVINACIEEMEASLPQEDESKDAAPAEAPSA